MHDVESVVLLVMTDNVSVNQKLFKLLQQNFHKETLSVIYHSFENCFFKFLSLAFDPPRNSHRSCSIKKVFLKISKNSQENACVGVSA